MSENIPKKILKAPFDKLLSGVMYRLDGLEASLNQIKTKQAEIIDNQQQITDRLARTAGPRVFQVSDTSMLVKIFSGVKMYLDPRDVALVPHLVLDGEWESNITRAWQAVQRPGTVIVDIGANFGYFGALASQYTNRESKVIYFEANPNLISYINKTLDVNSFDATSVVENAAISDKSGKLSLNILKGYIASSSLHDLKKINKFNKNKMEVSARVSVDSVSLDSYCEDRNIKNLDLIKMDIEGFEEKAYKGMRNIIKKSPNLIMFVEFTAEAYDNPKQFYTDMLGDFGHVYLITDDGKVISPVKSDYDSVIKFDYDWVMPIFSKKKLDIASQVIE